MGKWEKRNSDHISGIEKDESLTDEQFCAALEDLIEQAQISLDAKQEEIDEEDEPDEEA